MKARIYKLTEYLQRVEERLSLEQQRERPNGFALLHLKLLRLRIRNTLSRAIQRLAKPQVQAT
ncbi:hypothetical protein [Aurantiacibacter suaedae]|uniref:hypothetical protein n=1 Tax=Aurantiacibacter suaedae TaxID=2545755 RepID=UPI0010F43B74|nr:hypothetical protein [Aurantiacibacter suaedae]